MRKALGLLALSVVTLSVSACGASVSIGSKTFTTSDLESQLAKQLAPQANMKPSDITITCPEDVPVEKGHRFDCKLTVKDDGSTVVVKVTDTDDDGHVTATVPEQKATTAATS
jgi:hypothetical protein